MYVPASVDDLDGFFRFQWRRRDVHDNLLSDVLIIDSYYTDTHIKLEWMFSIYLIRKCWTNNIHISKRDSEHSKIKANSNCLVHRAMYQFQLQLIAIKIHMKNSVKPYLGFLNWSLINTRGLSEMLSLFH